MKQWYKGRLLKSIVLTVCATLMTSGLWAQSINLSLKNVTVRQVVEQLQKDYNYSFSISANDVDVTKVVSVNAENATINSVLTQVFAGQQVDFAVNGSVITVFKKTVAQQTPTKKTFSGIILDDTNAPVLGATIVINSSEGETGLISGLDGTFSFKTAASQLEVEISYVGYKTERIKVTNPSEYLTVQLSADATRMEDVVIIGYGSQRRELVTNAISSFKPDEDNSRTAMSPSELLQGRVAGMTVQTQSGNLGTAERVAIRGSASLNASNEPLYVIDGIPLNNESGSLYSYGEDLSSLSVLNLTDIESIEVLKDAASAAIYGSRATNGVILITTKQGREGKSDSKINYSAGIREFARPDRIDYATSESWIDVYNAGIANYNKQMGYTPTSSSYVKPIQNPFGSDMPDTDWLDLITRTGRFHNIDASFSGGNKNTTFYIGANYANEEGVIIKNDINKINLKSNLSHKMNSWLTVGANVSGNYLHTNRVPGANLGSSIIARSVEQRPFDRPYKPNGDYYLGGTDELTRHNPIQMTNESTSYVSNYRFLGAFYANVKLSDNLQVKASYSNDTGYTLDYLYYNANHPYCEDNGRIIEKNRLLMSNLFETVATYQNKIGEVDLDAMLGHSFQKTSSRNNSIDAQNFPSPGYDMVGSAAVMAGISGNLSEYAIESYFGRVGLSYADRYIANFTLRTDGSSRFAPEHRWGWFPSMSLGWNVSNEDFWENNQSELKLRASYGKTGNQDGISNYAWQPLIGSGANYDSQSGISVSNNGNPNLTWETADQYDMGFDLSFLKGKINIVFDIYLKNTHNLLYRMPTASTTGFTSVLSNIGSMQNKGVELTIDTHHDLGPVHWSSSFNITHNQNKLTKLLNDDIISLNDYHALQVGQEVGAFYLYKFDGIYQYDGEVPQAQYDLGVRAGDVKYHDYDGNGIINDKDRVIEGSANPLFSGGWSNTFDYKGFSLGIFFTYSYGGEVYAAWMRGPTRLGNYQAVLQEWADNYWTGPGSTNTYPRPIYSLHSQNVKESTYYLQDASFIRLSSVSLGYNVPKRILSKWNISAMRFYVQAENIWLLSHYRGWDPEVSTSTDPSLIGVDNYGVPRPTTGKIGVSVTF